MPVTAILFLTGTAAICALPPLNGFVSELLIYLGMLDGIASGSNVLASAAGLAALALIGGVVSWPLPNSTARCSSAHPAPTKSPSLRGR